MYSEALKDEWYRKFLEGSTYTEIQKEYGVNYRTVKKAIEIRERLHLSNATAEIKVSALKKNEDLIRELTEIAEGALAVRDLKLYFYTIDRLMRALDQHARLCGEFAPEKKEVKKTEETLNVALLFTKLMDKYVSMSDEEFQEEIVNLRKADNTIKIE